MALKIEIDEFDASKYLDTEEMIADYLAEAAEDLDSRLLFLALGAVAKARNTTQAAESIDRPAVDGPR